MAELGMSAQAGASCLEREHGGKGLLLSGVPGTRKGRVAILGGGIVGTAAARMAIGHGAEVTILDVSAEDGMEAAARRSPHLANGINTWEGACTMEAVAEAHGLEYTPLAF